MHICHAYIRIQNKLTNVYLIQFKCLNICLLCDHVYDLQLLVLDQWYRRPDGSVFSSIPTKELHGAGSEWHGTWWRWKHQNLYKKESQESSESHPTDPRVIQDVFNSCCQCHRCPISLWFVLDPFFRWPGSLWRVGFHPERLPRSMCLGVLIKIPLSESGNCRNFMLGV